MIAGLIEERLRAGARRGLRQFLLGLTGALALAVGLGFATAAGWIALSAAYGPLAAALGLGAVYAVLGLVLLALAVRADDRPQPAPEQRHRPGAAPRPGPDDPLAQVAAAFAEGYATGRALRGGSDPADR